MKLGYYAAILCIIVEVRYFSEKKKIKFYENRNFLLNFYSFPELSSSREEGAVSNYTFIILIVAFKMKKNVKSYGKQLIVMYIDSGITEANF